MRGGIQMESCTGAEVMVKALRNEGVQHVFGISGHGIVALLEALRILEEETGLTPPLVCTGTQKEAHGEIMKRVEALGLGDRVKFIGYCPFEEIPMIYKGAAAMVYPSLFEGFGLPVLEAMSVGCPVVCSNTSSLPEIAGKAAVYFDPRSANHICNEIERILVDEDKKDRLVVLGNKQIKGYSWDRFAEMIDLDIKNLFG